MRKYELMCLVRTDLNEKEREDVFSRVQETLKKQGAEISDAHIWAEKRKLFFELRQKSKGVSFHEAMYYVVSFASDPQQIAKLTQLFRINENLLRFLISATE